MSLTVKHLTTDASFLLSFRPVLPNLPLSAEQSSTLTVLIDPWLSGTSKIFHSKFSISRQTSEPCVSHLSELPEPDLVIISQDKSDHCHRETLTQLSGSGGKTIIIAEAAAAKLIKSWRHFDADKIVTLSKFEDTRPPKLSNRHRKPTPTQSIDDGPPKTSNIYRFPIQPLTPGGNAGEVTIALIVQKADITRLHNAIGITYKAPTGIYSADTRFMTPPATPRSFRSTFSHTGGNRTLSVLYSPHGCSYKTLQPYIHTHLVSEAAVPLTALLHCFDKVQNAWFLGGNICSGFPGGLEIVKNLQPKVWISAHDGDKETKGIATKKIVTQRYAKEEVESVVTPLSANFANPENVTEVMVLKAGEEIHLSHIMDFGPGRGSSFQGSERPGRIV